MASLLATGLAGALGGVLVGVVIVDYTDANASHAAIDLAVVALCALAGLTLGLLVRRDRPAGPRWRVPGVWRSGR